MLFRTVLVNLGVLVPSKRGGHKNFLQFEVHYLDTKEKSLLTFLCNQSRIILKFDFLLKVFHFITRKEENDYRGKVMLYCFALIVT